MKQKFYTMSTLVFKSLDEVKEQLETWQEADEIRPRTKIFEIAREISWRKEGIVIEEE